MDCNVYEQYFAARHPGKGTPRRAVRAALTVSSGEGRVRYAASLSFFPHEDEEDFAVSYDVYTERELFSAPGRRSKKREAALLETLREHADELAASLDGEILWDEPLRDARYG